MVDSHDSIRRGGAIQCVNLAISLGKLGHNVQCFFKNPDDKQIDEEFEILNKYHIPVFFYNLKNPISLLKLRQKILQDKPDIVHTHKNRALLAIFFSVWNKKQFIWVANRGTAYPFRKQSLVYYIHKHYVDKIIAVSYAVKDVLIKDGIDESKIEVVYGSFDPAIFHPGISGLQMRAKWGITENAKVIGLVGSFASKKKGQDVFLHAAKLVLKSHPDTYFVFIGDGDDKKMRELAKSLDIEKKVYFAGFYKDIQNAMAALDVLVCASLRGEGLTGAVREALAMEIPVISTDVAGNKELVQDHKTGLLVPPGDSDALSKAIIYLIDNPDKAKLFAKNGRELVYRLCTNEQRAKTIEKIYKSMLLMHGSREYVNETIP